MNKLNDKDNGNERERERERMCVCCMLCVKLRSKKNKLDPFLSVICSKHDSVIYNLF